MQNPPQLADIDNVTVIVKTPLQSQAEDVLKADAIIIGTTENFGYMAGLTKDFFSRIFTRAWAKQGLPVACYIRAGLDGTGSKRAVEVSSQDCVGAGYNRLWY